MKSISVSSDNFKKCTCIWDFAEEFLVGYKDESYLKECFKEKFIFQEEVDVGLISKISYNLKIRNLKWKNNHKNLIKLFKEKFGYSAGESLEDIPFRSGKAISQMELEKT